MKSTFLRFLVLTGLVIACSPSKKEEETRTLVSGVLLENIDTTVNPGDNFQMYVNGTWIKNTVIPADKSSYGVGRIVHEKSQEDVKSIIEEAAAANKAVGTDEQKVGDLYAAYLDMTRRDELGIAPLAPEFQKLTPLPARRIWPSISGMPAFTAMAIPSVCLWNRI